MQNDKSLGRRLVIAGGYHMAIVQCFVAAMAALFALVNVSFAQEVKATRVNKVREIWIARVQRDLRKVGGDELPSAAQYAVIAVAASGECDLAKAIAIQFLPPERRPGALISIADIQSSIDQLNESLATVCELPKENDRQLALALIAVRQTQRGDFDDANMLLSKITEQRWRGRALSSIAQAQAVAGEMDAARATVSHISDDEERQQAQDAIDRAEADPIRKICSDFLRQQIVAMLTFSGTESQREAISAIAAAQSNDDLARSISIP